MDFQNDGAEEYVKIIQSYKNLFNSPDGEMVIENLKSLVGYDDFMYYKGVESHELFYKEGRRSVVVHIINILKTKSNEFY